VYIFEEKVSRRLGPFCCGLFHHIFMAPEWKRGIKFNNATPCYSMSRTFYNSAALRKMKLIMRLGNRQLVPGL